MGVTGSLRSNEAAMPARGPLSPSAESIRENGYAAGEREARLFLSSTAPGFEQPVAYQWLDRIVADGRRQLRERNASDREIEIWDNACRIMFLLETLRERNRDCL